MAPAGQAPRCPAPGHLREAGQSSEQSPAGEAPWLYGAKPGKQGLRGQADPVLHREEEHTRLGKHIQVSV